MPESVGFVSSSVCACVILGASPGRGRRLWDRLRVVPHFSSGIVERAKRERA